MELYAGKHVILDAITTSEKITEIKPIYDFIELASNELEMTLVYPPLVAYFPFAASELSRFIEKLEKEQIKSETLNFYKEVLNRRKTLDSGVSGVGVQLESHISIHTQPEKSFMSLDLYSCKNFDHEKIINIILDYFKIERKSIIVLNRQINKPTEIIYNYSDIT